MRKEKCDKCGRTMTMEEAMSMGATLETQKYVCFSCSLLCAVTSVLAIVAIGAIIGAILS